jgi:hypothetical protein
MRGYRRVGCAELSIDAIRRYFRCVSDGFQLLLVTIPPHPGRGGLERWAGASLLVCIVRMARPCEGNYVLGYIRHVAFAEGKVGGARLEWVSDSSRHRPARGT